MIEVIVQLLPRGSREGARLLGIAKIANDGTGTQDRCDYDVTLSKFGGKGTWKKGFVQGFPRLKQGPWDILYQALRSVVGSRSEEERPLSMIVAAINTLPYEKLATVFLAAKARILSDEALKVEDKSLSELRDKMEKVRIALVDANTDSAYKQLVEAIIMLERYINHGSTET